MASTNSCFCASFIVEVLWIQKAQLLPMGVSSSLENEVQYMICLEIIRQCSVELVIGNHKLNVAGVQDCAVLLNRVLGKKSFVTESESLIFVVVQSLSCIRLFMTPWTAARKSSLSSLSPGVCLN